jgi:hypothetical protein
MEQTIISPSPVANKKIKVLGLPRGPLFIPIIRGRRCASRGETKTCEGMIRESSWSGRFMNRF